MKKKCIFLFVLCISILFYSFYCYASVLKAVKTDITAYIDGVEIPSYNINGYTAIVAEDLVNYGFDVQYFEKERILGISRSKGNTKITGVSKTNEPITQNIYPSNIITQVGRSRAKSYNIGGKTLILMDAMEYYGDVTWYPEQRKICFDYVPSWKMLLGKYEGDITENISHFSLELNYPITKYSNDKSENLQYFNDLDINWFKSSGFCFHFAIAEEYMEQTKNIRAILDNTTDENVSEHINLTINGEKVQLSSIVAEQSDNGIDYYFYFNKELRKIKEIETMRIEFQ